MFCELANKAPKSDRISLILPLVNANMFVEDDDTFMKFSYKKNITQDLYYNIYCGDMAEMIQKLPKKEYTLLIDDIPYRFRIVGSTCDDEQFKFKQLEKMVKDFP